MAALSDGCVNCGGFLDEDYILGKLPCEDIFRRMKQANIMALLNI